MCKLHIISNLEKLTDQVVSQNTAVLLPIALRTLYTIHVMAMQYNTVGYFQFSKTWWSYTVPSAKHWSMKLYACHD